MSDRPDKMCLLSATVWYKTWERVFVNWQSISLYSYDLYVFHTFVGGHSEVVNILLEADADVNQKLGSGVTALHMAAKSRCTMKPQCYLYNFLSFCWNLNRKCQQVSTMRNLRNMGCFELSTVAGSVIFFSQNVNLRSRLSHILQYPRGHIDLLAKL